MAAFLPSEQTEVLLGTARLDFRFADEEDADDISHLVNSAFFVKSVVKSVKREEEAEASVFRTGPRVDAQKLRSELENSCRVRWVVLETPIPVLTFLC